MGASYSNQYNENQYQIRHQHQLHHHIGTRSGSVINGLTANKDQLSAEISRELARQTPRKSQGKIMTLADVSSYCR